MLYTVNVHNSAKCPQPWDTTEGITTTTFNTEHIVPLRESPDPADVLKVNAERTLLGRLNDSSNVYIYHDGVGCIHAGRAPDSTVLLSKRTWLEIDGVWLRAEQVCVPQTTWADAVLSRLSWWCRFLNWLLRRRCGTCFYFDVVGAKEWRMKITHVFGGNHKGMDVSMEEKMWNDVTKMAASDVQAPDFFPGEFGYCPKRDCGLAATLVACKDFRKRGK